MKLAETKVCAWCEKEFTGRRVLAFSEDISDDAICYCSHGCFMDERDWDDEVEESISGYSWYEG